MFVLALTGCVVSLALLDRPGIGQDVVIVIVVDQDDVIVVGDISYRNRSRVCASVRWCRLPCMTDPALASTNSMSFPLFARVPTYTFALNRRV